MSLLEYTQKPFYGFQPPCRCMVLSCNWKHMHACAQTHTRTHTDKNMRFTHSIQLGLMRPARTLFSLWPGWCELGKPFALLCSYVLYPFPLSSARCLNYAVLRSPHSQSYEMTWRVLEFYQNVCVQSRSDILSDRIGLWFTHATLQPHPKGFSLWAQVCAGLKVAAVMSTED